MAEKGKVALAGFVVIVAFLAFSGFLDFGAQSVVSVSQVSLTSGGQNLQVNLVLNGYDKGTLTQRIDAAQTINASGISTVSGSLKAQSSMDFTFAKLQQFCSYSVSANSLNLGLLTSVLGIKGFTYYTVDTPIQHYPYSLKVSKSGLSNYQLFSGTIDVNKNSPITQNIIDPVSKKTVQINNLGLLGGGGQCPSGANTAIVKTSDGSFKPVLLSNVQSFSSFVQQCAFNLGLLQCLPAYSVYQQMFNTPTNEFKTCPAFTSCENVLTFSSNAASYTVNSNLGNPSVLISAPVSLFDSFYYMPPNGVPQVTVQMSSSSLTAQQYASMTVTLKNAGTTPDGFQILFSSRTGGVSIPSSDSVTLNAGQSVTKTYSVQASTGNTQDTLCAQVTAVGSGSQTSSCASVTVTVPLQPTATPIPTTTITPTATPPPGPTPVPQPAGQDNTFLVGIVALLVAVVAFMVLQKGGKGGSANVTKILQSPIAIGVFVGALGWYVSLTFLVGFTIPFIGQPFVGLAPLVGFVVGVLTFLMLSGRTQINISGARFG